MSSNAQLNDTAVLRLKRCLSDHPEIDIQGAKGAGLVPVWKAVPYWQVSSDVLRINVLSELLPPDRPSIDILLDV
jgi:hypothetical protein